MLCNFAANTFIMEKEDKSLVETALRRVLSGEVLDEDTLYALAAISSESGEKALLEAAKLITSKFTPRKFDTCSIVNARSGLCSENCKWCAQSSHYSTGCDKYELVDADEAKKVARYNADCGIGRFSLVASGRAVHGRALEHVCRLLKEIKENDGISTCASLGLLSEDELKQLYDAGVHRYHCNLETAPSYFPSLCSTHTQTDKLATIAAAKKLGFEVCSGGIIGMGESRKQRMELAITLRQVEPVSIPINVLIPIPGTPLEHAEPISDREILLTVALFRVVHPAVTLRFAGGRARLSREVQLEALKIGINGGIVGDLLTTIGSTVDKDRQLINDAGYEF